MTTEWVVIILLAVAGLCLTYAMIAWVAVTVVSLWRRRRSPQNSVSLANLKSQFPQARSLRLKTDDGLDIDACFIHASGQAQPAGNVILLHGIDDCKERLLPLADELAGLGYNCLLIDFRGHGGSGGTMCSYGWYERQEVRAAVDWLAENAPGPVAVYGLSLGGAVALLAAADDGRISAVVTDGAYARLRQIIEDYSARCGAFRFLQPPAHWIIERLGRFRMDRCDPLSAAKKLAIPVLLIHGQADRHVRPDYSKQLAAAMNGQCELWLVPRAVHSRCRDLLGDAYVQRIDQFLRHAWQRAEDTVSSAAE